MSQDLNRAGLAQTLRDARKDRGQSQREFADDLAIDQGSISRAERGQLPGVAKSILEQLGYSIERQEVFTVSPPPTHAS